MVEICRIFTFSQDFVFSFSSKAEQGFPDAHGARHPLALRLVSQNLFREICSWTRWGSPIRPVGPKFKASPASGPNEGPSPTTTQARRPIPLAEMIHKGRRARSSLQRGETRPSRFFPKERCSWLPTKKGRKTSICKLMFFQILVGIWWYWVSRGHLLLVLGGTGSVLGSNGWFLVILGQYKAVLTGTWLYLLTFQMFRYHVFGAHSKNGYLVFRGLNQNCWWRMVCPRN